MCLCASVCLTKRKRCEKNVVMENYTHIFSNERNEKKKYKIYKKISNKKLFTIKYRIQLIN